MTAKSNTALPVFVYWDRPEIMPAYLHWCLQTWDQYAELGEVVLLHDANLAEWMSLDMLDWHALDEYSVTEKKDAIQVAILSLHGGLFLDADTIIVAPPGHLLGGLKNSEIVLYGNHMGVMAARRGSIFMRDWLKQLQQILASPRVPLPQPLGNMAYERLRDQYSGVTGYPPRMRKLVRGAVFGLGKRRYVTRLDRRQSGFMPELVGNCFFRPDHYQRYRALWFDESIPVERVFTPGQTLIGLHNSWHPAEFNGLDEEGLMRDKSLLSRALRYLRFGTPLPNVTD